MAVTALTSLSIWQRGRENKILHGWTESISVKRKENFDDGRTSYRFLGRDLEATQKATQKAETSGMLNKDKRCD